MNRFEVQGIVSNETGMPLVQLRQLDDEDVLLAGFQVTPMEARDIAHNILEATFNAIYDAALIAWAKEHGDEQMGAALVGMVRRYRADHWGLPDNPEDWRGSDSSEGENEVQILVSITIADYNEEVRINALFFLRKKG